jgi:hypothetical protein
VKCTYIVNAYIICVWLVRRGRGRGGGRGGRGRGGGRSYIDHKYGIHMVWYEV